MRNAAEPINTALNTNVNVPGRRENFLNNITERISRPPADPSDFKIIPDPIPVIIPAVKLARIIS
jgi:hypothetical protein